MTTYDHEFFHRYVEEARGAVETIRSGGAEQPASILERLEAAVEELRVAEEELKVQNEELRAQNDELTEKRRELERLNRRYMDLFDLAPIGYAVTDDQGVVTEANLAAETLLGLPGAKVRGKPIVLYVPERDRRTLREHITSAAAGKRPIWRGAIAPAQGSGPPVPVQFAVSLYGNPAPGRAVPVPGEPRQADASPGRELLWAITNLARVASLESEVRRLDDGMWARVAERTIHLTVKVEHLEAELHRYKNPPSGPQNMRI